MLVECQRLKKETHLKPLVEESSDNQNKMFQIREKNSIIELEIKRQKKNQKKKKTPCKN